MRTAPTPTDGTAQPDAAESAEVLLVEDDPVVARLVGHILDRRGFKVRAVSDGLNAESIVKTAARPAVVVMDLMLPYVSGFDLIALMRRTPGWARVPVLVLTAKGQEADILRAFDAGVDDYLVKPFRPEEFVARVRRLAA